MTTVSERFAQHYRARREMSDPADMVRLLIARLYYPVETRLPGAVTDLVKALERGDLAAIAGARKKDFAVWLRGFVALGRRTRGTSYYPIHPVLSRPPNREEARIDGFILTLVRAFSSDERERLFRALWGNLPPFEQVLYDLLEWQGAEPMTRSQEEFARQPADPDLVTAAAKIVDQTRDDLLALSAETAGVQSFTDHAGRLLALALARFLLAQAEVEMVLPVYVAPAADSHDGVRTLAHETIEAHRALLEKALRGQFEGFFQEAAGELGMEPNPSDPATARNLTLQIFHYNANVVPPHQYAQLLEDNGNLCGVSYFYYWQRSGAGSRFLRQLHTAHLNLSKKAGIANSRSQHSTWHYYWLAPSLVETLLLVTRPRLQRDRMLVEDLLRDWRERYGLAMLIDDSWEAAYHANFRGFGNPEALNEANQRRFNEILAERGRLHKNSDDFPWVVLRD